SDYRLLRGADGLYEQKQVSAPRLGRAVGRGEPIVSVLFSVRWDVLDQRRNWSAPFPSQLYISPRWLARSCTRPGTRPLTAVQIRDRALRSSSTPQASQPCRC